MCIPETARNSRGRSVRDYVASRVHGDGRRAAEQLAAPKPALTAVFTHRKEEKNKNKKKRKGRGRTGKESRKCWINSY